MREVRIGPRGGGNIGNPDFVALGEELEQLRRKAGRVFYIYSQVGSKACVLVTTSGQIQLELSRLSPGGQERVCKILVEESGKDENGEGLVVRPGDYGINMFVTPFHRNDSGYIFHISPAGGNHDNHDHGHGGHH